MKPLLFENHIIPVDRVYHRNQLFLMLASIRACIDQNDHQGTVVFPKDMEHYLCLNTFFVFELIAKVFPGYKAIHLQMDNRKGEVLLVWRLSGIQDLVAGL